MWANPRPEPTARFQELLSWRVTDLWCCGWVPRKENSKRLPEGDRVREVSSSPVVGTGLEGTGSIENRVRGRQGSLLLLQARFQANGTAQLWPPPPSSSLPYCPSRLPASPDLRRPPVHHPLSRLMLTVKVALGLVSSLLGLKRKKTKPRRCKRRPGACWLPHPARPAGPSAANLPP